MVVASLPTKETVLPPLYYQSKSSIATNRVNEIKEAYPCWMTPIVHYLSSRELPKLYSTPWYPQSNGHAESFNKTLLTAFKKRLHSTKGKWVDELLGFLWAYRTTNQKPTRMFPFALIYRMKAINLLLHRPKARLTQGLPEPRCEVVQAHLPY